MSKHLTTAGRKIVLLTGRNLRHDQGGAGPSVKSDWRSGQEATGKRHSKRIYVLCIYIYDIDNIKSGIPFVTQ